MIRTQEEMHEFSSLHPNLIVCPSQKTLLGLFTKIRDSNTCPTDFVTYSKRAMRLLAEDAIAELPSSTVTVQTPTGDDFCGVKLPESASISIVSIVRAGDALLESMRELLLGAAVGKILIQRDETTPDKTPRLLYSKLPPDMKTVILCDPMLATGGSACMALDILVNTHNVNPDNVIFCNVICCPEGLKCMAEKYPTVKIVTACVDQCLNENKYIVPGLGDYGDRFFNSV